MFSTFVQDLTLDAAQLLDILQNLFVFEGSLHLLAEFKEVSLFLGVEELIG